ncbi:MAG: septal ring lytic transglycosylase RlpA family protein [Actinomycetota bacterium]|nr:septal ring lytic transglycosylase RlpA family protein [Actinomycetota bacterium]
MFSIKRIVLCCVVVAMATASQTSVRAEEVVTPEPVIDEHPRAVAHLSDARISGHVENGDPAGTVHLQRKRADRDGFRSIASATLGRDLAVTFSVEDLRHTARYRLRYETRLSDSVRISVKPRLTLNISPDHVMSGRPLVVKGVLYPKMRGRRARLQWKVEGAWRTIERVSLGDGAYRVPLTAPAPGHRRVRITFAGDAYNGWARRADRAHSYERSLATWYGPGFYGNHTACGPRLQRDSIGVAHRVLPCGTKVEILYRGRTVTVPVIDRGPYGDSNWDLTQRTAEKINFSGKEYIGVLH